MNYIYVIFSANSNYELGRGDKIGGWKPKPIPSLEGVRIIQIVSGGYHSLALTGKYMQHNTISSRSCISVLYIYTHSEYVILDDGKVLSWGYGGHGQLGHSSLENQTAPTVVEALADERVIYIACGGSSSAAVTGEHS